MAVARHWNGRPPARVCDDDFRSNNWNWYLGKFGFWVDIFTGLLLIPNHCLAGVRWAILKSDRPPRVDE
jgi:hypothetical protein